MTFPGSKIEIWPRVKKFWRSRDFYCYGTIKKKKVRPPRIEPMVPESGPGAQTTELLRLDHRLFMSWIYSTVIEPKLRLNPF